MSETPRTDEVVLREYYSNPESPSVVYADFARQLERELAAARAEIERLKEEVEEWKREAQILDEACWDFRKVEADRDRLREAVYDIIGTEHHKHYDGPPPQYIQIAKAALAGAGETEKEVAQ